MLLFTGLAFAGNAGITGNKDTIESTIHEVLIFKWCKEGQHNIKRYIKIDSLGNVIIKNQNFLEKVDMKSFTKSIHNFITMEKPEKIAGNNDAPKLAVIPAAERQNIYISIILTEDYVKDKKLKNQSYYSWQQLDLDKFVNDYPFFKYLTKEETALFKRFLE